MWNLQKAQVTGQHRRRYKKQMSHNTWYVSRDSQKGLKLPEITDKCKNTSNEEKLFNTSQVDTVLLLTANILKNMTTYVRKSSTKSFEKIQNHN